MSDQNITQERVQALRSVDESIPPNAVPPATPDEIFYVDTHSDDESQKEVVLWDDIIQAFKHAERVRHKTKVVPLLKGNDFKILEPHRIAAVPNTVLDVIVASPSTNSGMTSPSGQQLGWLPAPPQDGETMAKLDIVRQTATEASNALTSPLLSSDATSPTVRRNPAGHEEAAIDNLSHMERPVASPFTNSGMTSLSGQQLGWLPAPPQDSEAMAKLDIVRQTATEASSALTSPLLSSDVTSPTVRRNPAGHEEAAIDNLSHMERPLVFPSAHGPQTESHYQASTGNGLPSTPRPDSSSYRQVRGPQSATSCVDPTKDLAQLAISASQGDKKSQVTLGDIYRDGRGVQQDNQAAFDWYLKAAEQGDPTGQHRLGDLYQYGQGVEQDYSKALNWYLMAADSGNVRSQREIADFYYNGRGVTKDYSQAMVWYRKAADQGDAGSQCKVGSLFEYGGGVRQDYAKAAEWYQKAADQNHLFAKKCLRALKENGYFV